MGKKQKKRKKDTAHRSPPLSRLDKGIYYVLIILPAFGILGILVGFDALHKWIAFQDPAVIAYKASILSVFPFLALLGIGMIVLACCYQSKRPIFGNKTIRYGDHPWKTNLFPLFGPQHRNVRRRPSEQRFRTVVTRIAAGALAVTLLLASFGIFRRTCLRDDRTIVTYNSLNRPSDPVHIPRDCDQITIRASKETTYRGGSPSWHYGIIISCENGKKYEFIEVDFDTSHRGHTDCLQRLLSIKALFSPDQITIEREDLLPDVINDCGLDEAQTALLRELFEPPN